MTYPMWRWDQGRLQYFRFDNIRAIAGSLKSLDGLSLDGHGHRLMREWLERDTGLPFLPKAYTVWRNYARVFACTLLASKIDNRLAITDVCDKLYGDGPDALDADSYLSLLASRTYMPSPAFVNYSVKAKQFYPFCAVLKFLIARFMQGREASITLPSVFSLIIGNGCDGSEPIEHYVTLKPSGMKPVSDQGRQVREMLIFLSQFSFLKWFGRTLYLDIMSGDVDSVRQIEALATPSVRNRQTVSAGEIVNLGTVLRKPTIDLVTSGRESILDTSFTEGKRTRVTHLRIERSPRLRKRFLVTLPQPNICNMCSCDTQVRYPWVDTLLEIHHLLPLSSSLVVEGAGTSLKDLVALCPTCHKGVHTYYRIWLRANEVEDFRSTEEAKTVYIEAKQQVVI